MEHFPIHHLRLITAGLALASLLAVPALGLAHSHGETPGGGDPSLERPLPGNGSDLREARDCTLCAHAHRGERHLIATSFATPPFPNRETLAVSKPEETLARKQLASYKTARAPPADA